MKYGKRWYAAGLCAVMLTAFPLTAWATGPAEEEIPKYDEATLARLQDNVVEYDELLNLIREYNPAISQAWKSFEDSRDNLQYMVTELESRSREVDDAVDEMSGNPATAVVGVTMKSVYRSTLKGIRDSFDDFYKNSNTVTLRKAENQVLAGAQQLMIGYSTVHQNIDTLNTQVQMYQAMYELKQNQAAQGLATQTDVLSAHTQLLSAQSSLLSLQTQEESLLDSLGLLLGWQAGARPQVMPVPAPDVNRIAAMNPAVDITAAIGNNYSLSSMRASSTANQGTSQKESKKMRIDEGEQNLAIELQRLYQDVLDKNTAYQASLTGFQSASLNWSAAERQYRLGMMARSQYLGSQIQYYAAKASKESAEMALFQAIETYDWAVKGIAGIA